MTEPNRHILIVDDEPNVRLVFRTALESSDYRISTAEDGASALAFLQTQAFDLVLLDLLMPGTGGMELLERLRASGNDVPVVIITAHGNVPNAVAAMKLGAIDFLSKPLTPERLRTVVADVAARHAAVALPPAEAKAARRPPDMLSSAKRALNHRLFQRAEALLHEALKEIPGSAEPRYLLGVLYELRDKPRAASDAYQAALRVDPSYLLAKLDLVRLESKARH